MQREAASGCSPCWRGWSVTHRTGFRRAGRSLCHVWRKREATHSDWLCHGWLRARGLTQDGPSPALTRSRSSQGQDKRRATPVGLAFRFRRTKGAFSPRALRRLAACSSSHSTPSCHAFASASRVRLRPQVAGVSPLSSPAASWWPSLASSRTASPAGGSPSPLASSAARVAPSHKPQCRGARALKPGMQPLRSRARSPQSLAGGELPPPLPPAPAVAAEPAAPYSTGAAGDLEHVEIEALPTGGFLLTLTGAGYDGTCEHIGPHETELWSVTEALSRLCSLAGSLATASEEACLHARLLTMLQARAARFSRRCAA